eukprot:309410-Chlamydomonas_euryale.AAC.2
MKEGVSVFLVGQGCVGVREAGRQGVRVPRRCVKVPRRCVKVPRRCVKVGVKACACQDDCAEANGQVAWWISVRSIRCLSRPTHCQHTCHLCGRPGPFVGPRAVNTHAICAVDPVHLWAHALSTRVIFVRSTWSLFGPTPWRHACLSCGRPGPSLGPRPGDTRAFRAVDPVPLWAHALAARVPSPAVCEPRTDLPRIVSVLSQIRA